MPRKEKLPAVVLPFPPVPTRSAPESPAPSLPTPAGAPISPAVEIWLDVFADAIVATALREAAHA